MSLARPPWMTLFRRVPTTGVVLGPAPPPELPRATGVPNPWVRTAHAYYPPPAAYYSHPPYPPWPPTEGSVFSVYLWGFLQHDASQVKVRLLLFESLHRRASLAAPARVFSGLPSTFVSPRPSAPTVIMLPFADHEVIWPRCHSALRVVLDRPGGVVSRDPAYLGSIGPYGRQ